MKGVLMCRPLLRTRLGMSALCVALLSASAWFITACTDASRSPTALEAHIGGLHRQVVAGTGGCDDEDPDYDICEFCAENPGSCKNSDGSDSGLGDYSPTFVQRSFLQGVINDITCAGMQQWLQGLLDNGRLVVFPYNNAPDIMGQTETSGYNVPLNDPGTTVRINDGYLGPIELPKTLRHEYIHAFMGNYNTPQEERAAQNAEASCF